MPGDEIDALFEVPPAEFVHARDELARSLRQDKRADEARRVRQLRRPTVVVWVMNQLARHHHDDVAQLLDAAEQVGTAQRSGQRDRLREASEQLSRQIAELAGVAVELLGGEQRAGARRAEVEAALRALALSGDSAGEWRSGRLQQLPASPSGEEMWTAAAPATEQTADAHEGDAKQTRLDDQLAHAQSTHRATEIDVDRARARLDRAQARVDDLEARLGEARSAYDSAASELQASERRLRDAEREIERLERKRDRRP